jgi:hypothetical protein
MDGASAGITIVDEVPSSRAANATAWAWFPEENARTPVWRSAAGIEAIRL